MRADDPDVPDPQTGSANEPVEHSGVAPRSLGIGASGRSDTARRAGDHRAIARMDGPAGFVLFPACTDALIDALEAVPGFADSPERSHLGSDPSDLPTLVMDATRGYATRLARTTGEGPLPAGAAAFLAAIEGAVAAGYPPCVEMIEVEVFEALDDRDIGCRRLIEALGPRTAERFRTWRSDADVGT